MSVIAAYCDYSESGVEWLGSVPTHWTMTKLKHVAPFQVGWTPPTKNSADFEGENLWANISDIKTRIISDTAKRISDNAAAVASMEITPRGSLLYSFKLSVGAVAFAGVDMYTNEAIASFLPNKNLPLTFLYYSFPIFVIQNAATNIYGARILNQNLIKNADLLAPPIEEAAHIAKFLDYETAKIDALIEKQQQLIALLKEKRQAVISHAVTKGLNPNAPMRDSGIEWLGKVPAHWEIWKISHLMQLRSGETLSAEQLNATGSYPVYGGNGFRGFFTEYNHVGDYILIGRQGALCGNINYGRGKFWATEHALVVYPQQELQCKWLGETLRSMNLNQYSMSAAQPGLSVSNIICLRVPVPPQEERKGIANFIEAKTQKIDNIASRASEGIGLLQERRTALISAAVTGKIDVRGWTAPESETEAEVA